MTYFTELAWAAGLFDGEGCIHITRVAPRKRVVNTSYCLVLKVCMVDKRAIDELRRITETGVVARRKPLNRPRENACYEWRCWGKEAAAVLRNLRPYLITKAKEADIALKFDTLPTFRGTHGGVPIAIAKKRDRLYIALRLCKPRAKFYKPISALESST